MNKDFSGNVYKQILLQNEPVWGIYSYWTGDQKRYCVLMMDERKQEHTAIQEKITQGVANMLLLKYKEKK